MAFKWSAIEAFEQWDSRREWFDGDGKFHAQVTLMCVWEDRFKLVQDLYTSQFGLVDPEIHSGYNPRVWPDPGGDSDPGDFAAPVMSKIGVISATLRNMPEVGPAKDVNGQVYDYKTTAFVDVQYGRYYNIQDSISYDATTITQTYLDFRWKTKAFPKDLRYVQELEMPAVTLYTAVLTRDFIGLAPKSAAGNTPLRPDITTLHGCVGKVNGEAYTSDQLGITFNKGTLLMTEPDLRDSVDMQNISPNNQFGARGFAASVRFLYKEGGDLQGQDEDTHNLFWRPLMPDTTNTFRGGWDRLLIPEPGVQRGQGGQGGWKEFQPFKENPDISKHWLTPGYPPLAVT